MELSRRQCDDRALEVAGRETAQHLMDDERAAVLVAVHAAVQPQRRPLGRALQEGAKTLRLYGQEVAVNAEIVELGQFSAHAGKSELLRTLVAGLAVASSPDHLTFVLIDYKGGSTFDACARLPHVVGLVTDLDDHLAESGVAMPARRAPSPRADAARGRSGRLGRVPAVARRRCAAPPRGGHRRVRGAGLGATRLLARVGRHRPTRSQPGGASDPGDAAAQRRDQRRHSGQHESSVGASPA